jgi:hypothetical protein
MLGVFWLSYLGWIDAAAIAMPETYLRPQIAGGIVFGAGFALAGLCPGTSCVAAASGRGDGMAAAAGLFAGVLAMGAAFPLLLDFYDSDARGAWTLPALFHVPPGVVVFGVVLVALAGFAGAQWIERRPRPLVAPVTDRRSSGEQENRRGGDQGRSWFFRQTVSPVSCSPASPDLLSSGGPGQASRVGWSLAIAALVLAMGAAIIKAPPPHPRQTSVYKPPSGC